MIFLALLVAFLYGLSPILQKVVLNNTHKTVVLVLSSFFYFVASLVFGLYNWNVMKHGLLNISMSSIAILAFVAVVTAFIANLVFLTILGHHDSYFVTALVASSPAFTLALAYFFLQESINWMGVFGVMLITIGVIVLAMAKNSSN